jgi:alpha-tubulin suppressor-like RCC1 family protein
MDPTSNPSSLDQPKTGRATKAKRRKISIALAIVVVIAIGITAVIAISGDNKSARSGAYTSGDPLVWTAVEAGSIHTCALVNSGQVKCWGDNYNMQLGDGTSTGSNIPVLVSGIPSATDGPTATSISSGEAHSCAVLSNGQVKCWGTNNYGRLGNGFAITSSPVPALVSGITTATSISAGSLHSCALLSDGQVKCWGRGREGQLGNGTYSDKYTPYSVSGITTATSITTGLDHSCALLSDGQVKCWGTNNYGQLGNEAQPNSNIPVFVSGITTATSITTGLNHSCASLSDGQVKCWGTNNYGQLGDGTKTNSNLPVFVSGITTATRISSGHENSCAVLSNGQVKCWGNNYRGQLGNGTKTTANTPVLVSGIPTTTGATATSISSGYDHSCVVLSDGQIKCWGFNSRFGQLGDGTLIDGITPVSVALP